MFDLQSVTGGITDAELRVFNPANGFVSPDPSETYTLFEIATPVSELRAGGSGGLSIFEDLGSGVMYGSQTISSADADRLVVVPLTAAAITDLNARGTDQVALGGAFTTLAKGGPQERAFAFTGAQRTPELSLTLGDRSDFYEVTVDGNDTLRIETLTPARRVGEFVNSLDPMIRLYDGNGNLLAWDDNSSIDGSTPL